MHNAERVPVALRLQRPWLESKEHPQVALLEIAPCEMLEEKAAKWNAQNKIIQPRHMAKEVFLWDGD